jgi:CheY-like chemotaxis protein
MPDPKIAPLRYRHGRVLVVDDDPEVRPLMQDVLERRGFDVVVVESGAEALAYLARDTASLILLDLEMDDIDGWEVMGALKRHADFDKFQIVVVSGTGGHVPKWAGYLRKPFRVDALLALLEEREAAAAGARSAAGAPTSRRQG